MARVSGDTDERRMELYGLGYDCQMIAKEFGYFSSGHIYQWFKKNKVKPNPKPRNYSGKLKSRSITTQCWTCENCSPLKCYKFDMNKTKKGMEAFRARYWKDWAKEDRQYAECHRGKQKIKKYVTEVVIDCKLYKEDNSDQNTTRKVRS